MESPHRNAMLVVAVAALAILAGCTGGGGPGPATPTNNSSQESIEPLDDLNGTYLNNATRAAVADGGSYTSQTDSYYEVNSTLQQYETVTNTSTQVDLESERGFRTVNQTFPGSTSGGTAEVYTDGNTSYQRTNTTQGVNYAVQTGNGAQIRPVNVTAYNQNYTVLTDAFDYEADGTETIDGTATVRYTSTNLTEESYFVGGTNATVSDASATLYVDADGVVRQASIAYTIEAQSGSSQTDLTLRLTDIGSTSVEEPGWLAEAQNSTS